MTERRPMTTSEEVLILKALGCPHALPIEVAHYAQLVAAERAPKPITPEERAVIDAARAWVRWLGGLNIGVISDPAAAAVIAAVRRLP